LVATGVVAYWHVGVVALCAGLANTLFNVVRQSFVNETVGRDDVVNAVALSAAAFNGARIVGPAAAGLVIASVGVAPAFVCSAARATFSCSPPWPRSAWRAARAAAAACSVLLALRLIESVWLAAVALFLLGYTGVITSAGCQTSLQLRSSDELRGRVMSLFTLIHGGCFPIAAPLIGAVAERSSVR